MKSKNVFLIRNVKPECYGGGETYQLVLAGQLMKYGYSPIIVSSSKKLLSEAKMRGIKAIKAPYLKKQNFSGFSNFLLPAYLIHLMKLKRWYKNLFLEYKPKDKVKLPYVLKQAEKAFDKNDMELWKLSSLYQ